MGNAPGRFGRPGAPSQAPAVSSAPPPICDGRWIRVRWTRDPLFIVSLNCTCYWSCYLPRRPRRRVRESQPRSTSNAGQNNLQRRAWEGLHSQERATTACVSRQVDHGARAVRAISKTIRSSMAGVSRIPASACCHIVLGKTKWRLRSSSKTANT
jgi:hypothetical protein